VRVTLFIVPFTAVIPRPIDRTKMAHVQIFAPIDDERTMFYGIFFSQDGSPIDEREVRRDLRAERGVQLDEHYFKYARVENWWNQDREAMKNGSWIGIDGFPNQDMACQESMGPIVDRTQEHLGTSDIAIIRMRRRMLEAVRRYQNGDPLIGQEAAIPFDRLRSEQKIIPIDAPWQSVGAYAGEYAAT
jgi:phthalate 4,5-dioxygenase oxygenase subunit